MNKLDFHNEPIVLGRVYRSVFTPEGETVTFNEETIETADTAQYIPYEWPDVKQIQAEREARRKLRRRIDI